MFDFGDELTIESYRVPWLIWIQLVVMLLLIFLLYCFGIFFAFDLSDDAAAAATNSSSSSAAAGGTSSSTCQITSADDSRRDQSRRDTTVATVAAGSHGNKVGEHVQESSTKDAANFARFRDSHHPCHYFGLAKQAFLKCLGLDALFESSSERRKRKDS